MGDFNYIGRSDALRLADQTADWACVYSAVRDCYQVTHIPTGLSCEVDTYELMQKSAAGLSQVQLKNLLLNVATQKIARQQGADV